MPTSSHSCIGKSSALRSDITYCNAGYIFYVYIRFAQFAHRLIDMLPILIVQLTGFDLFYHRTAYRIYTIGYFDKRIAWARIDHHSCSSRDGKNGICFEFSYQCSTVDSKSRRNIQPRNGCRTLVITVLMRLPVCEVLVPLSSMNEIFQILLVDGCRHTVRRLE